MIDYEFFYNLATYGNEAWKGKFTPEEVIQNANDYLSEFYASNEQGKATHTMEELCKLLMDDVLEGSSNEAAYFLFCIFHESKWSARPFYCDRCKKREIVFFSKEEIDNLEKHENREMCIQDAIPEKPLWVREVYVSDICLCPKCWDKFWNGEFLFL